MLIIIFSSHFLGSSVLKGCVRTYFFFGVGFMYTVVYIHGRIFFLHMSFVVGVLTAFFFTRCCVVCG